MKNIVSISLKNHKIQDLTAAKFQKWTFRGRPQNGITQACRKSRRTIFNCSEKPNGWILLAGRLLHPGQFFWNAYQVAEVVDAHVGVVF